MKNNYFDNEKPNKNKSASSRPASKKRKKKKRKKLGFGKTILLIIALIVLAASAFLITIKILVPDYDFSQLVPKSISNMVSENTSSEQTTAKTTTNPAKKEKTTVKMLSYLEDEEFKFETSKQGNSIGNLLNGGKAATDYSYDYHIVDGKGIYRIAPYNESYACVYKTTDTLSSMNLRGDYIYFVNETNGKLLKLQKGTEKAKEIAGDVKFVYVYDSSVYYITNENSLCIMDAKELSPTTLYYGADNELQFIGISKNRVFFSVKGETETEYLTVDNAAQEKVCPFRESDGAKTNFVLENGFLYYIEASGEEYSIVRQKFGSEKTFPLVTTKTDMCYPIIDSNRLYYADMSNSTLVMKEYNMNSKETKTMLKGAKLSDGDKAYIFHGGEYDFIIGSDYRASSNLTSSTNLMKFKNGKWSY